MITNVLIEELEAIKDILLLNKLYAPKDRNNLYTAQLMDRQEELEDWLWNVAPKAYDEYMRKQEK